MQGARQFGYTPQKKNADHGKKTRRGMPHFNKTKKKYIKSPLNYHEKGSW